MAIKIDALADAVAKELASYSQECTDELKTMVKKTAKEAVQELTVSSPKDSGEYAAGWTSRVEYESQDDIRVSIYNKKKPQLTHLLEAGHNARFYGFLDCFYPEWRQARACLRAGAPVLPPEE